MKSNTQIYLATIFVVFLSAFLGVHFALGYGIGSLIICIIEELRE